MFPEKLYENYVQILKDELIPAMGCTEPIAISYAAALARKTLGMTPDTVQISVSRNIIKNVKSVIVPHTNGMRGIQAAAAIGIIAGDADAQLEVISHVTQEEIAQTREYLQTASFSMSPSESSHIFDIEILVSSASHSAKIRIIDFHTNVVLIEKDGEILFSKEQPQKTAAIETDKSLLSIKDIFAFADCVNITDVKEVLDRQIAYNMAIAKEGLTGNYGANVGKVLLRTYGEQDVKIKAKAYAAAGSDARMNGCELPVIINSGSGNQGITASVPLIIFAEDLGVSEDLLYRALVVSNLSTLHIKEGIGRLSAYCGAVGAGCGCAAGIAYLHGKDYEFGGRALENGLAIVSGIICDGAKASCAAKIASSVDAGIMGFYMTCEDQYFQSGDGIVKQTVENTIKSVGQLASIGMSETDKEIIKIMIEE